MKKEHFQITKDYIQLNVDSKVYSKETIFAAGYVFLDKAYILLDSDKGHFNVYLYPQHKNSDLKKLALDFSNELMNYSHYFSRAKNNAEAIKAIMQRALFSVAPSLVQEAEEKEIQDLIKELEEEEKNEKEKKQLVPAKKRKR